MAINDILRNRRLELGMSMKDLAEKVGVSEGTISRWESGKIEDMRRNKIKALADALHLSPSVIMEWEEPPEEPSYYHDPAAADIAEFLHKNPHYKVLFDASRKVKPEDIDFVRQMIDRMTPDD